MKKKTISLALCTFCIMLSMVLSACGDKNKYVPKGEFYVKTSPSAGDVGVDSVIDLEAEYKTYRGEGDIVVPVTIGFGHLPGHGGYGEDDAFCADIDELVDMVEQMKERFAVLDERERERQREYRHELALKRRESKM